MNWLAQVLENGDRHVTPINDLRPHSFSKFCWCNPVDDDGVWVHDAMDGRQVLERGEVRLS